MANTTLDSGRWSGRGLVLIALFFWVAACDGGCDTGCGGFADEPYPEAHYNKTVAGSAEIRLSSHGLEFLSSEVDNLIGEFLEDGLSFCIPPTYTDQADICHQDTYCDDGSLGCQLDLSIDDAQIRAEAPNRLIVEITIGDLLEELPVTIDHLWSSDCTLHLYGSSEDVPAQIPVDAIIAFEVDTQSALNDTRIEIVDVQLDDSDLDYRVTDSATCVTLGWAVETFADGMIRDMLQDEIEGMVDSMGDEMLCRSCEDGEPACPSNATCEPNDDDAMICMYDEDNCVAMLLGIEGLLEVGELLGDMTARGAADVHLTTRLADRAVADTGLTLAMRSGFEPEYYSTCVPVDPTMRPSFDAIEPSPTINADVKPNGDPFMLGVGIHRTTIQHLLWSMWATGGLCIQVGADTVDMLTTTAIGTLVDGVGDIATRQGPVEIRLSPQTMPVVELGDNVMNDGEVVDGLLNVIWEDLDIHMYGFVQERFARMFTLRIDLELPVALVADDEGLLPVLGDVEESISNMRVINKELVHADVETFEELIPMLLGFALPDLMDSLSDPIELPEFAGYRIAIGDGDLTSADGGDVLALFASLEYVGVDPNALYARTHALVEGHRIAVDRQGRLPRVTAHLEVDATVADLPVGGEVVEYLYRLNGGAWMPAGTGPELALRHPSLTVQGEHKLELLARRIDQDSSWQRWPTKTELIVDYEPPVVEIWQEGAQLLVDAFDVVDRPEQMQMRYRFVADGQADSWSNWGDVTAVELADHPLADELAVEVEVRDRAGLSTMEEIALRQAAVYTAAADVDEPAAGDEPRGCGGCGATGGGAGTPLVLLLAALGLIALRRRRKLALMGLVTAVALMASGCSGCGDETTTGACAAECPDGEACIDGECAVPSCNDIDCEELACPDGQVGVCDDGQCVCEDYCASGCESDEFCCYQSNSCQGYPDWCADTDCDDGYEPQITHIGDADSQTCEVVDGACECVAMAPIDMRIHGAYLSMDEEPGGGTVAVAVHNIGYGDLMVGILEGGKLGVAQWHFVDGVPDTGVVAGDPEGPRRGIITRGRVVGTHTALAVDGEGTIHVFYRHENDDSLKYARGIESGGEWIFELTDVEDDVDTGYFSSVVERDGILHLVYNARLDSQESELRYRAVAVDTAMDDISETDAVVIHSGETDEEGLEDYLRVAGLFAQLIDDGDGLFLSFYDNTRRQAGWLAYEDEEGWGEPTFFDELADPYVSARPDANGDVHLAYMDKSIPALVYRAPGGDLELVADGIRDTPSGWSEMAVGHDVQLHIGDDGSVELLYHDASTHELKRAIRDDGNWELLTLAGVAGEPGAAHGLYVRRLATAEGYLIGDFSVDHTIDEERSVGQPTFRIVD